MAVAVAVHSLGISLYSGKLQFEEREKDSAALKTIAYKQVIDKVDSWLDSQHHAFLQITGLRTAWRHQQRSCQQKEREQQATASKRRVSI